MTGMTKEEGINQVYGGGGHVVILGAGASIASTYRNPEKNGKRLPSMDNFIDVVGLGDLIDQIPEKLRAKNFETLYGNLHNHDPESAILTEIESRIQDYFGNMEKTDHADPSNGPERSLQKSFLLAYSMTIRRMLTPLKIRYRMLHLIFSLTTIISLSNVPPVISNFKPTAFRKVNSALPSPFSVYI